MFGNISYDLNFVTCVPEAVRLGGSEGQLLLKPLLCSPMALSPDLRFGFGECRVSMVWVSVAMVLMGMD